MKVLNKGIKNINGFNLKWLYVKKGPYCNNYFTYDFDTITERIGVKAYLDYERSSCYGSIDERAFGNLRCYSDDTFGLYSTGISSSCDYFYTGITESQMGEMQFKVYPNPANSEIIIEFDLIETKNVAIEIKNIFGQTVKIIDSRAFANGNNKINIDVSVFSKGLYFVQLKSAYKLLNKKFVKQ